MAQPASIALWTIALGLPLSLFEYLYHRYLLHSAVLPFMKVMNDAHREHHGLTAVKAPVSANEPEKMVPVFNEYAIEQKYQEEAMMFPFFAISIFYGIFGLTLGLPLKLMFPEAPIISATLLAVTLYYSAYELWHQVLHLPYEKTWGRVMQWPGMRGITRYVYSFHLMHHWRPTANQAVVGFWGFALWDHLFRTHRRPNNLPIRGATVNHFDARINQPRWPIRTLDRWQGSLYRWSRSVEAKFAHWFGRSSRT